MTCKRAIQIGFWFVLGPLLGVLQTGPTFFPGNANLKTGELRTLLLISVVYGTGWLTSALLLSDFALLRRPLGASVLWQYLGLIVAFAVLSGLVFREFLIMVGYPITAGAIVLIAWMFEKARLAER